MLPDGWHPFLFGGGAEKVKKWTDAVAGIVTIFGFRYVNKFKEDNDTVRAVAVGLDDSVTQNIIRLYALVATLVNGKISDSSTPVGTCPVGP